MSLTAFIVRVEPPSELRAHADHAVARFLESLTLQKALHIDVGPVRIDFASIWPDQNSAAIATRVDPADPSNVHAVIFDGWLENRDELVRQLDTVEAHFQSSDARLVLESLGRWGDNAINRLYGDYSFVSIRVSGRSAVPDIFAVRDKVGIRPLFYAEAGGRIAISNLPGALAAVPWVDVSLNEGYAAEFLAAEINSVGETLYRGVSRIIGGHRLSTREGQKPTVARYYRPNDTVSRLRQEESVEAFRERFMEAVYSASGDPHPAGLMLSGGIDSSSIAMALADLAAAGRVDPGKLTGLSLVFPGQACDEQLYLDAIEAVVPFKIERFTPVYATCETVAEQTARLKYVVFPFAASGMTVLANYQHKQGGRVILNGEGGDELLLAYAHALRGALLNPRDWASARKYLATRRRSLPTGFSWRGQLRQLVNPLLGWPIENVLNRLRDRQRSGWISPVDPSWSERVQLSARLDQLSPPAFARTVSMALASSGFWAETNENAFFHSLLRGQESRSPMLSARMLEFCNTLPLTMLDGQTEYSRQLLRTSVRHRLPALIAARRGKSEFSSALLPALETAVAARFGANWSCPRLCNAGSSTITRQESPQIWRLDAAQSFAAFASHCL